VAVLAVAVSLAVVLVATGNIHLFATKQVECLKVVKKQKTAIGKLKSLRWVIFLDFKTQHEIACFTYIKKRPCFSQNKGVCIYNQYPLQIVFQT
jgi:hypothetical protein